MQSRRRGRARCRSELRCMVCQNQSIDDSDAPLARDLRLLVRERIARGDSDTQVIDFLVARYGPFVLLKPPIQPAHHAAVALAAAGAGGRRDRARALRAPTRKRASAVSQNDTLPLSGEEQAELHASWAARGPATPAERVATPCVSWSQRHYQRLIRQPVPRKGACPMFVFERRRSGVAEIRHRTGDDIDVPPP